MSALIALPSNLERRFLLSSGEILGAVRHLTGEKSNCLRIELLNYITFTGSSRAAATWDIQNLVEMGALCRTGERRHTR
jgi:Fic family protein